MNTFTAKRVKKRYLKIFLSYLNTEVQCESLSEYLVLQPNFS
jgi:hypothetical protein